jgi:hypothetical protein
MIRFRSEALRVWATQHALIVFWPRLCRLLCNANHKQHARVWPLCMPLCCLWFALHPKVTRVRYACNQNAIKACRVAQILRASEWDPIIAQNSVEWAMHAPQALLEAFRYATLFTHI